MPFTKYLEFFDRYASLLSSEVRGNDILRQLSIAQQDSLTVTYAPFDHVPLHADLVIVGITPGRTQAINAIASASGALRAGKDNKEASRLAKLTGSFSGPMRANLVSMLDHIGFFCPWHRNVHDSVRSDSRVSSPDIGVAVPGFCPRSELQWRYGYAEHTTIEIYDRHLPRR